MSDPREPSRTAAWSPYQFYVLAILILIGVFNYVDRAILGILQEPIKRELGLSDWQLGVLSGPTFALFYSLLGIPIARWAERGSRIFIVSAALATWSAMTVLCGLARNYTQLVLFRIGVGMGEAGCSAPSHSMVADYFPPLQRARAMALYTTSIPIGLLVGSLIGGFVAHAWGWRMAFVVAGIPGILLAVLARYTVREPERGLLDSAASGHGATVVPSFREAMRILFRNRTFVHIVVAAATGGLAVYGVNSFGGPYFMRQHGLDAAETGIVLASGLGVAGLVGTLFGGFMADRFAASDPRVYVLVPAVGAALSGLFFIVSFMQSNWLVAAAFFILAYLFNGFKNGPSFAAVLNLFPSRMRATAAAVNLMAITLIGLGLGPLLVGGLSDLVAAATFPAQLGDFAESCPGGRALASRAAELGAACTGASATGVRAGLTAAAAVYFLSMLHYLLAARTIRQHMTV